MLPDSRTTAVHSLTADRAQGVNRSEPQTAQRRPRRRAVTICLLLIICLLLCLAFSACVSTLALPGCSSGNNDCTGIDIAGARLEVKDQPLLQSPTLWLSAGNQNRSADQLIITWDSYTFHFHPNGTPCDVDTCAVPPPCNRYALVPTGLTPTVVAFEGFVRNPPPQVIATTDGSPASYESGCRSFQGMPPPVGFAPPIFTPQFSGIYEVHTPSPVTPLTDQFVAAKNLFVIANGMPQTASYQMERLPDVDPNYPSIFWFKFTTSNDDFSSNLRVGHVSILKVKGAVSPNPVALMGDVIRPSRIFVAQNYNPQLRVLPQGRGNFCYADSSADGNIDFTNCRGNSGLLTPTYLIGQQPTDRLTWFAEFNPNETQTQGATAPTLNPGEVLAIVFTIQGS